MTSKGIATILMTGLAAAVILSGCGKKSTKEPVAADLESVVETVASTGKKVGISFPSDSDSRWVRDAEYFTNTFKSRGYDTMVVYAGDNASQQANDLSVLISNACDLIIAAPVDASALSSVVDRAGEQGIPVISYDDLICGTESVTNYVTFDDYGAGVLEAQYLIDKLDLKAGDASKEHTIEYAASQMDKSDIGLVYNGIYDTLKPFFDADVLLTRSMQNTFTEALTTITPESIAESVPDVALAEEEAVSNAIAAGYDQIKKRMADISDNYYGKDKSLDAVLCTDALAVKAASEGVSSGYSGKNDVLIAGSGVDEEVLENLINGKQDMAVFEASDDLRELTVELGISLMLGEKPDETLIEKHSWSVEFRYDTASYDNGSRIVASYLALPTVVTKDTIESKVVEPGYYTMNGKYPKKN